MAWIYSTPNSFTREYFSPTHTQNPCQHVEMQKCKHPPYPNLLSWKIIQLYSMEKLQREYCIEVLKLDNGSLITDEMKYFII